MLAASSAFGQSQGLFKWVVVPPEQVVPGITSISWATKDTVWGGTAMSLVRSVDGGWHWEVVPNSHPGAVFFRNGHLGCVIDSGVSRITSDAGVSWVQSSVPLNANVAQVYWLTDSILVGVGLTTNVWRSSNAGMTWASNKDYPVIITCGAFVSNNGYIFGNATGFPKPPFPYGAYCAVTIDFAATTNRIYVDIPDLVEDCALLSSDSLFALNSDTVYFSKNHGADWERVPTPIQGVRDSECRSIKIRRGKGLIYFSNLFDGRNSGILESNDRGRTWQIGVLPIENISLTQSALFSDSAGMLLTSTGTLLHTDGFIDASTPRSVGPSAEAISVTPNPANSVIEVHFSQSSTHAATLRIVDASGKVELVRDLGTLGEGERSVTLPVSELASGVYYLELVAETTSRAAFTVAH